MPSDGITQWHLAQVWKSSLQTSIGENLGSLASGPNILGLNGAQIRCRKSRLVFFESDVSSHLRVRAGPVGGVDEMVGVFRRHRVSGKLFGAVLLRANLFHN